MSEPFIGEIKLFAGNFAPRGYAFCSGQLLPISQNTALFSILGTIYGGDGRSTLGLPNLVDRVPMHPGNGPGLSSRRLGERSGTNEVTLQSANLPAHSHGMRANDSAANSASANGNRAANAVMYADPGNLMNMGASTSDAGGSEPHENRQPFLKINFIIALQGIFPSRS